MVMRQLLIILLSFQFVSSSAQQGVLWAKIHGDDISSFPERVIDLETDGKGNVYVGGHLNTQFVRDSNGNVIPSIKYPGQDSLYNNGGKDAWVTSYTKEGDHRWTKYAGSGTDDEYYAIEVSQNGDVFVSGFIWDSQIRPPRNFDGQLLGSDGVGAFISKLDSDGNLIWHQNFGGDTVFNSFYLMYNAYVIDIKLNSNNTISCFIEGGGPVLNFYQKLFDRDSLELGIHEVIFDDRGNYLKSNSYPFPVYDKLPRIFDIRKESGKVIMSGVIERDTAIVGNDTLLRNGFDDALLICFDTNTNYQWSFNSSNYFDQFLDLDISGDSILVSGHFDLFASDTVNYDTISYISSPNNNQAASIFIFDINTGGILGMQPSRSRGFGTSVNAGGIAVSNQFMAIGGLFPGELTFSGTSNYITAIDNCTNCTNFDVFFAVFQRNGSFFLEDVIYSSGNSGEGINALHIVDSTLYIAGLIGDSVLIPNVDTLYARGDNDAFVASYRLSFTTSIQENPKIIKASNGILAYPNPTEGNIRLLGESLGEIAYLYSISGQLIREYRVSTKLTNQAVNLNDLNTGIYMLIIPGSSGTQQLKIIKQ